MAQEDDEARRATPPPPGRYRLPSEPLDGPEARVEALEAELRATRSRLQVAVEELESKNLQLESRNEDLSRLNEELALANEELRFANGQLAAFNSELRDRHQHRARLAAIVEASEDAIIGKTLEGTITSWNAGAEALYGWTAAEVVGRNISLIVPPELAHELPTILQHISQGLRVESFETERVRKDGSRVPISVGVSPVRDAQGRVVAASTIARDLTGTRQAQAAAEQSRTLLQLIVDALPALVSYVDADGRYRLINRSYSRWFGRPAGEAIGRSLSDVLGRDAAAQIAPYVQRAMRGETVGYELQLPYRDSGPRWVRADYVPDRAADGTVRGFVALVQDVEQQKAIEQRLSDADRRKNEFLAMLAHELRNPLAAVVSGVELIAPTLEQSGDTALHQVIMRQLAHLARLVDDLLDVARITAGHIELRRATMDARQAVRESIDGCRDLLAARSHAVEVRLPETPVLLWADHDRVVQILTNLISNACRYMKERGSIQVEVSEADAEATFVVADQGEGIAKEDIENIFDLFVQGKRSLAREHGGLGIGLTTVARLVQLHGGRVVAESAGEGKGATFRVVLPTGPVQADVGADLRADIPAAVPGNTRPEPAAKRARCGSSARRVLIVEDNADAAEMLGMILRRLGHDVRTCGDGESVFAHADEFRPEVVLLDIGLPKMDGYQVARRLRENAGADRPSLVALSGYGRDEDIRKALEAGFDAHLTKPITSEALKRLLDAPPRR